MLWRSATLFTASALLGLVGLTGCARAGDIYEGGDEINAAKGDDEKGSPNEAAADPAPAGGDPTPAAAPIAPAKVHDAPVSAYALAKDAVFVASTFAVQRTALDGSSAAPVTGLAGTVMLASDGGRLFAAIDRGAATDIVSAKPDGSDFVKHGTWDEFFGKPATLSVNKGRVFLGTLRADDPKSSRIDSLPMTPPAASQPIVWTHHERVDAANVPPAFADDTLLALDYSRQSAAVRITSGSTTDVIRAAMPVGAGGIATDRVDVYTRTDQGIVKAAVGAPANTVPTVVIPTAECSVIDPSTGEVSAIEDAIAIDGTTIYAACRSGMSVEVRAYAKDGKRLKVIASVPWHGGLSHVRLNEAAVYWMLETTTPGQSELWRAGK